MTRASLLYFDTLLPSSGLCVLRNGFLFAAAAVGESRLYQFAAMGDEAGDVSAHSDGPAVTLAPRAVERPKNVALRERLGGLAPLSCSLCADVTTQGQGPPQLWVGSGLGEAGALSELRRGLPVAVLASQQLPGVPECVWTLLPAAPRPGGPTTMLVLAFANATLSLGVNAAGAVAELPEAESQILAGVPSLHVAALGSQGDLLQVGGNGLLLFAFFSLAQVTPHVLRHVRPGGRVNVWNPPAKLRIAHAASAGSQVLLGLSSGELVYFELDPQAGVLLELERLEAGPAGVACLALAPAEAGARARWAAYADGEGRLR